MAWALAKQALWTLPHHLLAGNLQQTGSLGGSVRESAGFLLPILTHPEEAPSSLGQAQGAHTGCPPGAPGGMRGPPRTAISEPLEPPQEAHLPERGQACQLPHQWWKPAAVHGPWRHGEGCALLLS